MPVTATPGNSSISDAKIRDTSSPSPTKDQYISLSPTEISAAFKFISKDGRKITKSDVSQFISTYLPHIADKLDRTILAGSEKGRVATGGTSRATSSVSTKKDEMTLQALTKLLRKSGTSSDEYKCEWNEVSKIFDSLNYSYAAGNLHSPSSASQRETLHNPATPTPLGSKTGTVFYPKSLDSYIKLMTSDSFQLPSDFSDLMKLLDQDNDGVVGCEDWKGLQFAIEQKMNDVGSNKFKFSY